MTSPNRRLSSLGEFGLIDWMAGQMPHDRSVVRSIGDDTAVLEFALAKNKYLLFTTDMMIEGVHFTRAMGAKNIGYKALACNISDIAAMGGAPTYAVISLGVPRNLELRFVQDMYRGIKSLAQQFKINIVGGDTVRSRAIVINIALLGAVGKKNLVLRDGAKKGDRIFVTGRLGRSLRTGKHLRFLPRVAEADHLVKNFKPSAMIDISDGLLADLGHILTSSRVGAVLQEELIPRTSGATIREALSDGEDYELLFTLNPRAARRLEKSSRYRFFCLGEIAGPGGTIEILNRYGKSYTITRQGFTHF